MLQEIVSREKVSRRHSRPGTYSIRLQLSCGHYVVREGRKEPIKKAYCDQCQSSQATS